MTESLRNCITCGRTFWPEQGSGDKAFCPNCGRIERMTEGTPLKSAPRPNGKFVSLSQIENSRYPHKRGEEAPALPVPAITKLPTFPRPLPQQLPQPPVHPAADAAEVPTAPATGVQLPQMAFNCPACFTVLVIKDSLSYDGKPAPCPYCRTVILPPRIAQASPFTLVAHGPGPARLSNPEPQPTSPAEPTATPVSALPDQFWQS